MPIESHAYTVNVCHGPVHPTPLTTSPPLPSTHLLLSPLSLPSIAFSNVLLSANGRRPTTTRPAVRPLLPCTKTTPPAITQRGGTPGLYTILRHTQGKQTGCSVRRCLAAAPREGKQCLQHPYTTRLRRANPERSSWCMYRKGVLSIELAGGKF